MAGLEKDHFLIKCAVPHLVALFDLRTAARSFRDLLFQTVVKQQPGRERRIPPYLYIHAVEHRHVFLPENILDLSDSPCNRSRFSSQGGALLLHDLGGRKSFLHRTRISPVQVLRSRAVFRRNTWSHQRRHCGHPRRGAHRASGVRRLGRLPSSLHLVSSWFIPIVNAWQLWRASQYFFFISAINAVASSSDSTGFKFAIKRDFFTSVSAVPPLYKIFTLSAAISYLLFKSRAQPFPASCFHLHMTEKFPPKCTNATNPTVYFSMFPVYS